MDKALSERIFLKSEILTILIFSIFSFADEAHNLEFFYEQAQVSLSYIEITVYA